MQRAVGQNGQAGILHPARRKIVHTNLVIFGPGIRHADFLFKERHRLFRIRRKRIDRFLDFRRRREEGERNALVFVLHFFEIARAKRNQIRRVRLLLQPPHRHQP